MRESNPHDLTVITLFESGKHANAILLSGGSRD
jgi:hypothetical protein